MVAVGRAAATLSTLLASPNKTQDPPNPSSSSYICLYLSLLWPRFITCTCGAIRLLFASKACVHYSPLQHMHQACNHAQLAPCPSLSTMQLHMDVLGLSLQARVRNAGATSTQLLHA